MAVQVASEGNPSPSALAVKKSTNGGSPTPSVSISFFLPTRSIQDNQQSSPSTGGTPALERSLQQVEHSSRSPFRQPLAPKTQQARIEAIQSNAKVSTQRQLPRTDSITGQRVKLMPKTRQPGKINTEPMVPTHAVGRHILVPKSKKRIMEQGMILAAFLADDKPLGQLMEASFTAYDMKIRQKEEAYSNFGKYQTLPYKCKPENDDVDTRASKFKLHPDSNAERKIIVYNACASRIQAAKLRELAARERRTAQEPGFGRRTPASCKLNVWVD